MNKIKPYKEQYSIMKKATEPMVTYTNNRKSSNVIADARDDIRCVIFSEEFKIDLNLVYIKVLFE